jgi:hypothetical protein
LGVMCKYDETHFDKFGTILYNQGLSDYS